MQKGKGASTDKPREFLLTDNDFDLLRGMVMQHAGIALSESKRDLVYSRLSRRLRVLGLRSFDQYCRILQQGDQDELIEFINAITTNLTSFFRESHHFEFLENKLLPELVQKHRKDKIRIWSAGCSTGEEPYSIAMVIRDFIRKYGYFSLDAKILATDIDSNVIAVAQKGVYSKQKLTSIPADKAIKYLGNSNNLGADFLKITDEVQSLISFKQLNLIEPWPLNNLFDIIFCRNVVIYFSKDTQRTLFERFANQLEPRAYLFVGHSESLFKVCDRFESLGRTIYQKIS